MRYFFAIGLIYLDKYEVKNAGQGRRLIWHLVQKGNNQAGIHIFVNLVAARKPFYRRLSRVRLRLFVSPRFSE